MLHYGVLGALRALFCVHQSQCLSAGIPGQCINVRDSATSRRQAGRESADWVQGPIGKVYVQMSDAVKAPYAVIETGGKQYRVSEGDTITVERLGDEAGSEITIDRVLMIGGNGATKIGTPVVDGASVTATIDEHKRGEKIVVFKYKAKKRYRRKTGHRQELTRLTITGITG